MITERTLRRWRAEALKLVDDKELCSVQGMRPVVELCDRILRMTQELLDQQLLQKGVK